MFVKESCFVWLQAEEKLFVLAHNEAKERVANIPVPAISTTESGYEKEDNAMQVREG